MIVAAAVFTSSFGWQQESQPAAHAGARVLFEGSKAEALPQEGARADTFVLGVPSTFADQLPFMQANEAAKVVAACVYQPLAFFDEAGEVRYLNASSVLIEDQGCRLRVRLEGGISFSDGTPLDAQAVVASYQWFMAHNTAYSTALAYLSAVDASSDNEVTFTFFNASAENFAVLSVPLVSGGADAGGLEAPFSGTGPYTVSSVEPYGDVVLTRREGADLKKAPMANVVLRQFPSQNLGTVLADQSFDGFFLSDREKVAVQDCGAYTIYAWPQEAGWFLGFGPGLSSSARAAVAQLVSANEVLEAAGVSGLAAKGVAEPWGGVSDDEAAAAAGAEDGLTGIEQLILAHNAGGTSEALVEQITGRFAKHGVEVEPLLRGDEPLSFEGADVTLFAGTADMALDNEDKAALLASLDGTELSSYFKALERFLVEDVRIAPLTREVTLVACLATKELPWVAVLA